MNKFFFRISYFFFLLPFGTKAQESPTQGIWLLIDKQFLEGPLYQNGVPKILETNSDASSLILAMTTMGEDKDTTEQESFKAANGYTLVSMTSKGRQKKIHLDVFQPANLWIREVDMSAMGKINQPAIKIVDSLQFSEDGKQLTFIRRYKGENKPDGTQDYTISGSYKKVTAEELARETTTGKGVEWTTGLTWPQILEKAKQENKYVFVDCYATWCGPCKKMDEQVFPLNWVGEILNRHFWAVKVQMDTGKNDPDKIRLTYPIARQLEREYQIDGLPTYLFFNGNGELVDKGVGSFETSDFVAMLEKAVDPKFQVYSQYRLATQGKLSLDQLKVLIDQLLQERYNDKKSAKALMRIYIDQKFYALSDEGLLTKDNLEEIFTFWSAVKSTDRIFKLLYHDPERINQLLGKEKGEDYSQLFLESIILGEEVLPAIDGQTFSNNTPNWKELQRTIVQKYGKFYAVRPILNAQVWWYKKHSQWELYCNYFLQQVRIGLSRMQAIEDLTKPNNDLFGLANYLNGVAWEMFLHSSKKEQLEEALKWAKQSMDLQIEQKMKNAPLFGSCDTYGSLLYKLGRKDEATSFYQKMLIDRLPASAISPQNLFCLRLYKMKQNKPTWEDLK